MIASKPGCQEERHLLQTISTSFCWTSVTPPLVQECSIAGVQLRLPPQVSCLHPSSLLAWSPEGPQGRLIWELETAQRRLIASSIHGCSATLAGTERAGYLRHRHRMEFGDEYIPKPTRTLWFVVSKCESQCRIHKL